MDDTPASAEAPAPILCDCNACEKARLTAEVERLRGLVDDWSLKAVKRRVEAENLRAENERLTAALERIIAEYPEGFDCHKYARAALKEKTAADYGISLENPAIALTQEPRT